MPDFTPGKETTITAQGKTWIVGRLELKAIFGFRDWIKEQIGDPYARLDRIKDLLPQDKVIERIKAIDKDLDELEAFTIQSDIAQRFLATESGGAQFFKLLLQANHPDVTDEQAFAVLQEIGAAKQAEAIKAAAGKIEGNGQAPEPTPATGLAATL